MPERRPRPRHLIRHRRTRAAFAIVLAVVAGLSFAGGAAAQVCADGDSSISQLYETLPSASCARPLQVRPRGPAPLSRVTTRRLAAHGRVGLAVVRLVDTTLPSGTRRGSQEGGRREARADSVKASAAVLSARGRGVVGDVLNAITASWSEGGTGIALAVVLVGMLIFGLASRLRRRPRA